MPRYEGTWVVGTRVLVPGYEVREYQYPGTRLLVPGTRLLVPGYEVISAGVRGY